MSIVQPVLPFHWIKGACTSFRFPFINIPLGFFFFVTERYICMIHFFIYLSRVLVHFWTDVLDNPGSLHENWTSGYRRCSKQHYHKNEGTAKAEESSRLQCLWACRFWFVFGMHNRKNSCEWETLSIINIVQKQYLLLVEITKCRAVISVHFWL